MEKKIVYTWVLSILFPNRQCDSLRANKVLFNVNVYVNVHVNVNVNVKNIYKPC